MTNYNYYNDKEMKVYLAYYSFDNNGTKTISLHHINQDWCEWAILANGGIVMMRIADRDVERVSRLCLEMGITISPTIVH